MLPGILEVNSLPAHFLVSLKLICMNKSFNTLSFTMKLRYVIPLFFPALIVAQAQEFKLVYRFPAGKEHRYKRTEKTAAIGQTQKGLLADIDKTVETFFTLKGELTSSGEIALLYSQDTAFVDDRSVSNRAMTSSRPDFDNILTRKPVRLSITSNGELLNAVPTTPLSAPGSAVALNQSILARQAMLLPALPKRAVGVGDSWTEVDSDTLLPKSSDPVLGKGEGLRLTSVKTVYTADSLVRIGGYNCLKISWQGTVLVEGKTIFKGSEIFTEEEAWIEGALYFAHKEGLLVKLAIRNRKETTRAVFATDSEIIPMSFTTESTIELLPS